jgi:hypothetical protein
MAGGFCGAWGEVMCEPFSQKAVSEANEMGLITLEWPVGKRSQALYN